MAEDYKNLILTAPYEICIESARYVTRAFRETEGMHPSIRAARAFEKTATCMSISIHECEGLAGNRTSKLVGTPLTVERGDVNTLIMLELDALLNRKRQPYHIDPADRKELFKDILPYWESRSVRAARKKLWVESGRHIKLGLGPRSINTFEQLMDAYKKQVRFMIDNVAAAVDQKDKVYAEGFHNPYVSMTLDGCLDSAMDMTRGGARYNYSSISARGLGTAADSLAAIKAVVYDRKKFSMDQLLRALDRNFSGREKMRRYLQRKTPKYGSDDEKADEIAREVAGFFCLDVAGRKGYRGGPFRPGFFSYGMHVVEGALLGATPDGRLAGRPISNSLSPSNGTERNGPTGVMNSLSRIDHTLISNGCALNIRLLPSLLSTPEKRRKFGAMIRAYFDRGGMEVQFNVVDNATLRDGLEDAAHGPGAGVGELLVEHEDVGVRARYGRLDERVAKAGEREHALLQL